MTVHNNSSGHAAAPRVVSLALDSIGTEHFATRHEMGGSPWAEGLGDLLNSILTVGLQSPVKVRASAKAEGYFDLVYGHRRFHAHIMANEVASAEGRPPVFGTIPAVIFEGTEAEAWEQVLAENNQRADWSPSERAEAEAKLKAELEKAGEISTEKKRIPGKPTYGQLRSKVTGESVSTIEKKVRLGEATPRLRTAVDQKTITERAAFSLSSFDPNTQVKTLDYLSDKGVTKATEQQVHAVVEYLTNKAEAPALKLGKSYEPSEGTKTMSEHIEHTETESLVNGARLEAALTALSFYADPLTWKRGSKDPETGLWKDGRAQAEADKGHIAREIIARITGSTDKDAD